MFCAIEDSPQKIYRGRTCHMAETKTKMQMKTSVTISLEKRFTKVETRIYLENVIVNLDT